MKRILFTIFALASFGCLGSNEQTFTSSSSSSTESSSSSSQSSSDNTGRYANFRSLYSDFNRSWQATRDRFNTNNINLNSLRDLIEPYINEDGIVDAAFDGSDNLLDHVVDKNLLIIKLFEILKLDRKRYIKSIAKLAKAISLSNLSLDSQLLEDAFIGGESGNQGDDDDSLIEIFNDNQNKEKIIKHIFANLLSTLNIKLEDVIEFINFENMAKSIVLKNEKSKKSIKLDFNKSQFLESINCDDSLKTKHGDIITVLKNLKQFFKEIFSSEDMYQALANYSGNKLNEILHPRNESLYKDMFNKILEIQKLEKELSILLDDKKSSEKDKNQLTKKIEDSKKERNKLFAKALVNLAKGKSKKHNLDDEKKEAEDVTFNKYLDSLESTIRNVINDDEEITLDNKALEEAIQKAKKEKYIFDLLDVNADIFGENCPGEAGIDITKKILVKFFINNLKSDQNKLLNKAISKPKDFNYKDLMTQINFLTALDQYQIETLGQILMYNKVTTNQEFISLLESTQDTALKSHKLKALAMYFPEVLTNDVNSFACPFSSETKEALTAILKKSQSK